MNYWVVKQEPEAYSWADFVKDGVTAWTGVRNFQARNNLRAMKKDDFVLYYHSVSDKQVVGVAKVAKEAYPDPTAKEGDWAAVDLSPLKPLESPIDLETIKSDKALSDMPLVRHGRLSVQPLTKAQFERILKLGKNERTMKEARAVIFDMDGVIVDSEPRHERAFLEVVTELGYGGNHGVEFANYVGRTDRELWVDFVARNKPAHSLDALLAMKRERVLEILRKDQPLFAGLPELIERLAVKYRLALASGSEPLVVEEVLRFKMLRRYFTAVTTASEVKNGKPAPDIFLRAAQLLGVNPQECWVIEDSKPGVAAGLAADMRVIAITNTHAAEELANATNVVGSYEEIGEILLNQ